MKRELLYIVVILILSACGNTSQEQPDQIKIGLVNWIGYTPFYIAQEQGYFKKYGIEVELIRIEDVGLRRQAIASGQIDAVALTLDAMIVARDNDIPVKSILALDQSNGGDGILVGTEVNSIDELTGLKVAYQTGQPSQLFLYEILRQQQMSFDDIEPVLMDADRAGAAFIGQQVDAAVTWEPWLTQAEQQGKGKVLLDSKSTPGLITDVLYAREDVLGQKHDAFVSLAKSWYEAVDYLQNNPEGAATIAAEAFSMAQDEVALLMPKVVFLGREGNAQAFGTPEQSGYLYERYQTIVQAWTAESIISQVQLPGQGLEPAVVRATYQQVQATTH